MSDCDLCVYGSDDGDVPEFSTEEIVVARRVHRCCECGDSIPAKAQYERVTGKWDGDVCTHKTCLACRDIRRTFFCDGWTYGLLWEDFEESEGFTRLTTGCVAKLDTAVGKQKLTQRWQEWKFDQ